MRDAALAREGRSGMRAVWAGRLRVARRWVDQSLVGRWLEQLVAMQFVDRAVALAAKAFVAVLPVVVAAVAIAPDEVRDDMVDTLRRRMGLSGTSLELVRTGLPAGQEIQVVTGVFSGLLLLLYTLSFTAALHRMYLAAWGLPRDTDRTTPLKGLAWLACVIVMLWLAGVIDDRVSGPVSLAVISALAWAGSTGLWWGTSYLMLRRRYRWRVLLPPALFSSTGSLLYALAAVVWMPRTVAANEAQFGFFGVATTLVSWLTGLAFVIVGSSAIGPVLAYDAGRVGRFVRGSTGQVRRDGIDPAAWKGARDDGATPRREVMPDG